MSYNIDEWVDRGIVDLCIPVAALLKSERTTWHPERTAEGFRLSSGEIRGEVSKHRGTEIIRVANISLRGECSGIDWGEVVRPALKQSSGRMRCVQIWEGGDSVVVVDVHDGKITTSDPLEMVQRIDEPAR